ncbi:uncharacterized protein LOC112961195 isoform X2 [Apteryx rowi]|uniref:uncharacterized protein LOC112961195 isoform X2 n=1 Tax=Apteryx rowi TaxID=308060 RepID=UPI000E1CB576|nr:uncharacterized protein LOC112961195 isoform X2 [Apteryx rowi]
MKKSVVVSKKEPSCWEAEGLLFPCPVRRGMGSSSSQNVSSVFLLQGYIFCEGSYPTMWSSDRRDWTGRLQKHLPVLCFQSIFSSEREMEKERDKRCRSKVRPYKIAFNHHPSHEAQRQMTSFKDKRNKQHKQRPDFYNLNTWTGKIFNELNQQNENDWLTLYYVQLNICFPLLTPARLSPVSQSNLIITGKFKSGSAA